MKITVDTTADSKEHIQHMIEFLQKFVAANSAVQESAGYANIFADNTQESTPESSTPDPSPGVFGMFGDNDTPLPSADEKKDDDDDVPRIEIF